MLCSSPSPLSRERIARAAIEIADKDGLASVSLRKVAASLDAGPMRLYGYLSSKEELLGSRPHLGPNALVHLEEAFATLGDTPGFEDIDVAMQALRIVNAYVIGAIRIEASELRAELESGMNETEWQTAPGPYMQRMIATGRFPNLARVVQEATHPSADVEFDRGLDRVLDGIAARLPR